MTHKKIWKLFTAVVVTILLFALTPELRLLGLFIDGIGLDAFLLLLEVQFLAIAIMLYQERLKPFLLQLMKLCEKWDPYYFVPSISQIRAYPALIAHAIPFMVALCFLVSCHIWIYKPTV
ncbi:hypothetical protein L9G16_12230 [Shewanella sp. A25]|nr:hypothetical protein [Shewanella shenzhenensis]